MAVLGSLVLVLALVAGRKLPSSGGPGLRPADGPVAAALGAAVALLCLLHLADFHLRGGLLADDFEQYCATVGALRAGLDDGSHLQISRSAIAALPAVLLSSALGIVDGLLAASVLAVAALAGTLYLWGTALHGRVAGVVAALAVAGVGPLVIATRTLTFYPELAAGYGAAAFLVSLAVQRPTVARLALAAFAVGIVLALDQFGIGWALPFFAVLLAAVAAARHRLAGLGAVLAALALTWGLARALPPPLLPVQGQLLVETLDVRLGHHLGWHLSNTGSSPHRGRTTIDNPSTRAHLARLSAWQDGHLWGHSAPWAIVRTVGRVAPLAAEGMGVADESLAEGRSQADLGARVTRPWLLALPVLLVGGGLALRRQPRLVAATLVLVLPFLAWMLVARGIAIQRADAGHLETLRALAPVLGLDQADGVLLMVKPKFFMPAVVPLPLLAGLLVGWLCEGPAGAGGPWSGRALLRPLLAGGLLLLALLGALPTLFSPVAGWRWIHPAETEQLSRAFRTLEAGLPEEYLDDPGHMTEAACVQRLSEDAGRASPWTLRLVEER